MSPDVVIPSELLQIGVAVIGALTLGCIAILRGTIDTCRRSGRESRTGNLRLLLCRSAAPPYSHDNLIQYFNDFVDSYFCSNKLLLLRFALSTSLMVAAVSLGFLVFAYYLQYTVVVQVHTGFKKVEDLNQNRGIYIRTTLDELSSGTMRSIPEVEAKIPIILDADQANEKAISDSIPAAKLTISNAARVACIIVIALLATNLLITMLVAWLNEYLPELKGIIVV